jgi:hypothetical protein
MASGTFCENFDCRSCPLTSHHYPLHLENRDLYAGHLLRGWLDHLDIFLDRALSDEHPALLGHRRGHANGPNRVEPPTDGFQSEQN